MLEPKLQSIVEQLCNEGCRQVNVYINEIKNGDFPECMGALREDEQQQVLHELSSIMAVYDRCEP